MENAFLPKPAKVIKSERMTATEKSIKIELLDKEYAERFDYWPGQYVELSVMGVGEAPFTICSIGERKDRLDFCIRNAGRVSSAICRLEEGGSIGVRGPYGNGFPMEKMQGESLLLVAGGLGVAPLRPVLQYALGNRDKYKELTFFYGIRTYDTMLFRDEFISLMGNGEGQRCRFYLSHEDPNDKQCISLDAEHTDRCMCGVVTKLFENVEFSSDHTHVIVCGPPVMYKFVIRELLRKEVPPEKIYFSLERRLKCGLGKCGNCIAGNATCIKYVCRDGPVFTYRDAQQAKGLL
jgi:sulfhydrogenase subunit gamma (sulfur reductase)